MKKYLCTAMALLMAASLFVGCGCTNRNVSDHPAGKITKPTTATNPMPTMTEPSETATRPSTAPTTEGTMPSTGIHDGMDGTDGTDGTGILPNTSEPMPGTTEGARSGRNHGGSSGGNGAGGSSGGSSSGNVGNG